MLPKDYSSVANAVITAVSTGIIVKTSARNGYEGISNPRGIFNLSRTASGAMWFPPWRRGWRWERSSNGGFDSGELDV